MKCPNCGAEMEKESLYCERCGEDIHIVPDYEPELEFDISQTMSDIMEQVNGKEPESSESATDWGETTVWEKPAGQEVPEEPGQNKNAGQKEKKGSKEAALGKKQRHNAVKFIIIVLAVIILGLGTAGGIALYCYQSYDWQLQKAVECAAQKRYDKAVQYYNRALQINSQDVEVTFSLAEAYYRKGNKVEYEYLLRDIIREGNADEEQLERAYGKLIAIYKDRGEYDTINEILLASGNTEIQNAYQSYIARVPEFSYQSGSYTEIIPLKISSSTPGRIYYTLDGSEPDEDSQLYTAPVFLENGDYQVRAIFINEYGVASESICKEYHISVVLANAPEISVISGEYNTPMMIEVLDDDTEDVYYTTDGTTPNQHSNHYTGPIPMPLGKSNYCFAFVQEDGTSSEVAEREYELRLDTAFTEEQAVEIVISHMIATGKIMDRYGFYAEDEAGRYLYEFLYAVNIKEKGAFYIIAEVYNDGEGNLTRTGSFYGVNVYDGSLYKLQTEENSNYKLVEILIDSQEG